MKRRLLFSSIYTISLFLIFLFWVYRSELVNRDLSRLLELDYIVISFLFICIFLASLAGSYVITFAKSKGKTLQYFLTGTTIALYLGTIVAFLYPIGDQWHSSTLSEEELALKKAKKEGNERLLKLIEDVHMILDAPPPTKGEVDALVKNAINNMVRIEGGEFIMGVSPERMGGDWDGWKPTQNNARQQASIPDTAFYEHPVKLDTYYLSKYETSYAEFDAWKKLVGREIRFSGDDEYRFFFSGGVSYKTINTRMWDCCRSPNKPAAADWYEAKAYCEWLGEQSGLPVTLPTEAQWEYAARERGKWLMYSTAWGGLSRETQGDGNMTNPVDGLTHAYNDLGIYFMNGNLSEWVLDWYDPGYYEKSPINNPVNSDPGEVYISYGEYHTAKVYRGGGSFNTGGITGEENNVFNRRYAVPEKYSYGSIGIRCAVNSQQEALN